MNNLSNEVFIGLVKFSLFAGFLTLLFNFIVAYMDIQHGSPEFQKFGRTVDEMQMKLDEYKARNPSK